MKKWIGALGLVWLLWSDLSILTEDNLLDTIVLRWLARVPRLQADQVLAGRYDTAEECKAALERHVGTLKALNDSWSAEPFERDGDSGIIRYYPGGIVHARAALRCVQP